MVTHAAEAGANAIIGVRYDANEIASGITEVLAYGTPSSSNRNGHDAIRNVGS